MWIPINCRNGSGNCKNCNTKRNPNAKPRRNFPVAVVVVDKAERIHKPLTIVIGETWDADILAWIKSFHWRRRRLDGTRRFTVVSEREEIPTKKGPSFSTTATGSKQ
mmetsp:Transcript_28135/g.58903  ORF Transcript_28135/g.58903 Transcript_28135/m.58903 type:complete len:107 (-) Transcript_28135:82-402(-)